MEKIESEKKAELDKKVKPGKLKWAAIGITSLALAICCIIFLVVSYFNAHSVDKYLEDAYVGNVSSPSDTSSVSQSDFKSPINFDVLWNVNKDVYAWIEIANTKINYPIVECGSDSYYLNHAIDGSNDKNGTLFTEIFYNHSDFNDPVTVIYGHDMKSGAMFGTLQKYSDNEYFAKHNSINVYLPDRTLTYNVFAALPYNNKHILYSWNFNKEDNYNNFLRNIKSTKSLLANFDNSIEVTSSDKIIILSTCLKSNNTQRFLVMAVLAGEQN